MDTIEIPIHELHARTGHCVRLASREMEVIITENGKPAARITSLSLADRSPIPLGKPRQLLPPYSKALAPGKFTSGSASGLHETSALRDL
jgi:prevent-host-death family protein